MISHILSRLLDRLGEKGGEGGAYQKPFFEGLSKLQRDNHGTTGFGRSRGGGQTLDGAVLEHEIERTADVAELAQDVCAERVVAVGVDGDDARETAGLPRKRHHARYAGCAAHVRTRGEDAGAEHAAVLVAVEEEVVETSWGKIRR